MATTTQEARKNDPRYTSVQVQIRMPWWRRKQLEEAASKIGATFGPFLNELLDRQLKPDPPA